MRRPWEPLKVIGSHRQGPWCWLNVSDGWLINSALTLSSTPRDTSHDRTDSPISGCYAGDQAHISGPMNIRASATTDSHVVGNASAGQSYKVSGSQKSATWCWLKISAGWLANTSRVHSTKIVLTNIAGDQRRRSKPRCRLRNRYIDNCCDCGPAMSKRRANGLPGLLGET